MHREFALSPDILYLNHAAVAPWPRRSVDAVVRFAEENGSQGACDYPLWMGVEKRLRERLVTLIGAASPDDIALTKNTSEGLSLVAYGLDWRPGDNIVGILQEFPSNRIVWESVARKGVEYRQLDLYASRAPEQDLIGLCDEHTRLIAVSSVQYARGLRLDLERIAQHCAEREILLCVDGIQGLGAVPFDLARTPVDFLVADGHKWMLGPEGMALFYVRPELRSRLRIQQYGWRMVEHPGDYEEKEWSPSSSATRFECGSPNMLGIHGLEASLSLLLEVGIVAVHRAIEERIARLIELVDAAGFELLSPRPPERRAGILTFRVPDVDQERLYAELMARRLICAQRGGGIRFSPHFYTDEDDLARAMRMTTEVAHGLSGSA